MANPTPLGVRAGVARDILLSAIPLCLCQKGRLGGFCYTILYFLCLRYNFQDDVVRGEKLGQIVLPGVVWADREGKAYVLCAPSMFVY